MQPTQIASFDNFAALESHLQSSLGQYKESSSKYREALGEIMRSGEGKDDKWSQEMMAALGGGKAAPGGEKPKKNTKDKPKVFGDKKENPAATAGWAAFDPFSVFVGQGASGTAELYFDAINQIDETARKIQLSIDILGALRSRIAAPGSVSLLVSFVNDVPSKVILRPGTEGSKKKSWAFSFSVPAAIAALPAAQ
jgi:hypothetical protein